MLRLQRLSLFLPFCLLWIAASGCSPALDSTLGSAPVVTSSTSGETEPVEEPDQADSAAQGPGNPAVGAPAEAVEPPEDDVAEAKKPDAKKPKPEGRDVGGSAPVRPAEGGGDTKAGADDPGANAEKAAPSGDARTDGKLFRGGKSGDIIDISFDDLNLGMQADVVFRPFMLTDRAKELEGKRVRISGFILAADRIKGIKEFVLLRNTECKFGPGGQADHLVRVIMKQEETANYQTKPLSVEGVLKLNPFPDPRQTWSVFDLEGATNIRTVRR